MKDPLAVLQDHPPDAPQAVPSSPAREIRVLHNSSDVLHNRSEILHNSSEILHNSSEILHNRARILHNRSARQARFDHTLPSSSGSSTSERMSMSTCTTIASTIEPETRYRKAKISPSRVAISTPTAF